MRPVLFLLSTCLSLQAVTPWQVIVTPDEITGYGDFDADGRLDAVIAERATGLYRLAFQQADGTVQWSESRPSGMTSVDALTCGPIRVAGKDAVVLSGRLANQLVILEPTRSAATTNTEQIFPSGIGPHAIAAIDLPVAGNDPNLLDLVVYTGENSSPDPNQRHIFQSLAGSTDEALTADPLFPTERATRVRHSETGSDYLAAILRGTTDRLRIFRTTTTALPNKQTLTGLRSGSEFLVGPFSGSSRIHALIYLPGDPDLQVSLSNGSALLSPSSYTLDAAIETISPVGSGSFFVAFEGATQGRLYTLDASGTPLPGQAFSAPEGNRLAGAIGFDDLRMSLLSGPLAGGPATTSTDFTYDGTKWQQTGVTPLPASGSQVALTNVLLYDGEPLIDAGARLLETIQVPDWTSGISITSGGNVEVTPELYSTQDTGLIAGSSIILNPKSAPTHALGNQQEDAVSLISQQTFVGNLPPQVSVSPLPGKFTSAVTPILSTPDPGTTISYRFSGEADWRTAVSGSSLTPSGDTLSPFVLEYFAASSTGTRSPIYQAVYSYFGAPGQIDSDGDGVPDFVELSLGLDPSAGKDQDLDAVDDLYEVLLDTDPNDASSSPPLPLTLNLQNSFDLAILPVSPTSLTTFARPYPEGGAEAPTDVYLHSLDGTLLAHEVTRDVSGFLYPTAYFEKVPATDRDLFLIVSTSATFPIQSTANPKFGRELVGLIPVPHQDVGEFEFTYDGVSSTADAAAEWIAAAQQHYLSLTRPVISEVLSPGDSLSLLLFERLCNEYLHARNPALPSSSFLSLTGFRDPVAPRPLEAAVGGQPFSASEEQLRELQDWLTSDDPGHLLHDTYASLLKIIQLTPTTEMMAMKELSDQIAYYSDFLNVNVSPGLYPNPFDTLRSVVTQLAAKGNLVDGIISLPGETNNVGYARSISLTPTEIAAADSLLVGLLDSISDRDPISLTLEVGGDSFREGQVPILYDGNGLPYELYRSDGTPYLFQEPLAVGAQLEVVAFADRTHLPSYLGTSLDVISAQLSLVPQPDFIDRDQNALDDEWELFFFGQSTDPFADADGDGYSNLQELLEETNPTSPASVPSTTALPPGPPPIDIYQLPDGSLALETDFPSLYSEHITFALLTQTDLALTFQPVPGSLADDAGNDLYRLEIGPPSDEKRFFKLRLQLKP
ncbi:hypothetical protein [Roseibacillus persicicus]|uniref:hypothetical protein n=1 Tax=Roseibacillus persicicus TaxID=454148 RepID=UPI00280C3F9D|nr:hypothetical protein [Roseibacillus persicicus]MDQ8191658.1 hypothetical protein [Roseibacillus persicicus]